MPITTDVIFAIIQPLLNEQTYVALAVISCVGFIFYFMQPRRFYIVRHGETLLNAQHIRQGQDGGLSEKGRRQAEQAGRYFTQFPIRRIISSTYPRALETAEIINTFLHVPIIPTPFLIERRNPTIIIGKPSDDPEVVRVVDQMDLAYHDDEYRLLDEENFAELKTRARLCISLFSRQGARDTIVVTHHVFLKMLIAYILHRERLHASDFTKVSFFNFIGNSGVTVCEFHPWKIFSPTHGWEIASYNKKPKT